MHDYDEHVQERNCIVPLSIFSKIPNVVLTFCKRFIWFISNASLASGDSRVCKIAVNTSDSLACTERGEDGRETPD